MMPARRTTAFDLFTVGHSNHRIEHFIALLNSHDIACVADVRSRPFSRRFPWFSKDRLAERLAGDDIAYLAFGDRLGGRPADPALYGDGAVDYEAVAQTLTFCTGLDSVIAAGRRRRLCLMCAEKEPLDCHRCLLVGRALAERGLRIGHILADGSVERHAQTEERLLAAARVSGDLFSRDRATLLGEAYRRRARTAAFRAGAA